MYFLLIAGIGGFFGTIMRYSFNMIVYRLFPFASFPIGTMLINIIGCFFIGLIAALAQSRISLSPDIRIFLQIGVLGGFTTFSTFGYETFTLLQDGQFVYAAFNVAIQVFVGLMAVFIGFQLGQ